MKNQNIQLQQFLNYLQYEKNASPHTIASYKTGLSQFIEYIKANGKRLRYVNHHVIRGFLAQLHSKKKTRSTITVRLNAIREFFKFCIRKEWRKDNPAILISSPKYVRPLPSFLTENEAERFMALPIIALHNKTILELLYGAGIRVGELIRINVQDINFEERSIRIQGKGKKERIVLYGSRTEIAVIRYIEARALHIEEGSQEKALFLNYIGQRLSVRQVQRIIKKYLVLSEIKKEITPHSLRHSFASHLLGRGADLRVIQELLGHASLASTEKYIHIDTKQLIEIYKKAIPR